MSQAEIKDHRGARVGDIVIYRVGDEDLQHENDKGPFGVREHPAMITGFEDDQGVIVNLTVFWNTRDAPFGRVADIRAKVRHVFNSAPRAASWRQRSERVG